MNIVERGKREWQRYVGPKDERLESEVNRIYKVGFIMLAFGWMVLLYYGLLVKQVAAINSIAATGTATITFSFSELLSWGWPVATCLVLTVMQCRKGFVDTNRFGEVDLFPSRYFMLMSAAIGVCAGLLVMVLRVVANLQVVGLVDGAVWLVAVIMGSCSAVLIFAGCLLVFFLTFLAARRRRRTLESALDD